MSRAAALALAFLLGGCAATGTPWEPASAAPADTASARITVFRGGSLQYSGRSAALSLDGREIGALRLRGYRTLELPAGTHTLAIDLWDAPGRCELSFTAAAGESLYFEVTPRPQSVVAGLAGTLRPIRSPLELALNTGVMLAGMQAESAGKACGGAFEIAPLAAEAALPRLAGLRESE